MTVPTGVVSVVDVLLAAFNRGDLVALRAVLADYLVAWVTERDALWGLTADVSSR
ncbi:MAG: hypothetical protein JO147_10700 [Actinobacteria bacterium]|nr:hypothetical protein [Actinomycetota bacterium]